MSNDFKLFSGGVGANALTPAAYAALTTLLANGFQTGTASSQQINTVLRQATAFAAAFGQFCSDNGFNAVDDGTVATLKSAISGTLDSRYARFAGQVPVGSVLLLPSTNIPANFVKLNGALLSRSVYSSLYSFAGSSSNIVADATWTGGQKGSFSSGDGSTTFRVPDFRGYFLRFYHDGSSIDPDFASRVYGIVQSSMNLAHTHGIRTNAEGGSGGITGYVRDNFNGPGPVGAQGTESAGGVESRPINLMLTPIICFQ